MRRTAQQSIFLGLSLFLASCGQQSTPPGVEQSTDIDTKETTRLFQVRGVVKEIPETGTRIRIQHEEIPEYMPAMTMPFNVESREAVSHIKEGDTVSFTLHVTESRSWIDKLEPAKAGKNPGEMPSLSSFRQVRDVEPLAVGDPMPNYPFTDQYNKPLNLDNFRGRVLVMTFIYTRCPLPDFCPRMSMHFRSAYEAIRKDTNAPDNWHFLSITFDPAHDTPDVLRNYAKAYSYDPDKWSFVTSEIIEIDAITEQFGLMFNRSELSPTDWDHNLRTVIIDPHGTIHKIYIGNTWTPEVLVSDLKAAALTPSPASSERPPSSGPDDI